MISVYGVFGRSDLVGLTWGIQAAGIVFVFVFVFPYGIYARSEKLVWDTHHDAMKIMFFCHESGCFYYLILISLLFFWFSKSISTN